MVRIKNLTHTKLSCPDLSHGHSFEIRGGVEMDVSPRDYQTLKALFGDLIVRCNEPESVEPTPDVPENVRLGSGAPVIKTRRRSSRK